MALPWEHEDLNHKGLECLGCHNLMMLAVWWWCVNRKRMYHSGCLPVIPRDSLRSTSAQTSAWLTERFVGESVNFLAFVIKILNI